MRPQKYHRCVALSSFVLAKKNPFVFIWLLYGLVVVVIKLSNSKRSAEDRKWGRRHLCGSARAEGGHPSAVQVVKLEVVVPTARGLWGRNKANELLLVERWKETRERGKWVWVNEIRMWGCCNPVTHLRTFSGSPCAEYVHVKKGPIKKICQLFGC